jgi:ribosomal-protein-alanine N-acetyltransferase
MLFSFFRRTPSFTVQEMDAGAASACAAIHQRAFAHPWPVSEIEAMAASAGSVAHVAVTGKSDEVIGFVISRKVVDEAEVLTIAVDPGYRRLGVAVCLLEEHLTALAMGRVRRLFLEVNEGNAAALRLYQRFGFVEAARRPGYYRNAEGGRSNALVLRKDLI